MGLSLPDAEGNNAHRIVLKEQPWPRAFLKQSGRLRPAGLCFGLESLWARAKQQFTLHGRVHETILAAKRSGAETTASDAEIE